jgi:hypothetical protein
MHHCFLLICKLVFFFIIERQISCGVKKLKILALPLLKYYPEYTLRPKKNVILEIFGQIIKEVK